MRPLAAVIFAVLVIAPRAAIAAGDQTPWRAPTPSELSKMKTSVAAWICQGHPDCSARLSAVHVSKVPYNDYGIVYATAAVWFGGPDGQGMSILLYRQATVHATAMHGAWKGSPWWWVATPPPLSAPPTIGAIRISTDICRYVKQELQPADGTIEGC